MESNDLQSASIYVNNLLLARGLLRDGKSVDFARLAQPTERRKRKHQQQLRFEDGVDPEKEKERDGDPYKTTSQVLNLVHELILKRDRDQATQESTVQTLLTLRSEATTHSAHTRRLEAQNLDLKRRLAAAETSTRGGEAAARAAEASARKLRDEVERCKTLVAQVRTQCANDVRRRDLELARLKAHLRSTRAGLASTSQAAVIAPTCTFTRGSTSFGGSNARNPNSSTRHDEAHAMSVQDAEYSLRQETNEFLTQLSQSLSDENDALIALMRDTLSTLKDLQGLSDIPTTSSAAPSNMSHTHSLAAANNTNDTPLITALPTTYAALRDALTPVLSSLKDLLSTPSFVSIEEVHARDEEIDRLREGWEKMEQRWREAAGMMRGWRRRMVEGGDTVNLEEVRAGLRLGKCFGGGDERAVEGEAEEDDDGSGAGDFSEVGGEESLAQEELEHTESEKEGASMEAVGESILDAALATRSFTDTSAGTSSARSALHQDSPTSAATSPLAPDPSMAAGSTCATPLKQSTSNNATNQQENLSDAGSEDELASRAEGLTLG